MTQENTIEFVYSDNLISLLNLLKISHELKGDYIVVSSKIGPIAIKLWTKTQTPRPRCEFEVRS